MRVGWRSIGRDARRVVGYGRLSGQDIMYMFAFPVEGILGVNREGWNERNEKGRCHQTRNAAELS